jgi:hypothetical protein
MMKLLLLVTRRKAVERLPPATHHRVAEPDNSSTCWLISRESP